MSALENPDHFPFQDLIVNTCVISFILDKQSRILDANDQFCELLELSLNDKKPKSIKDYLEDPSSWKTYIEKLEKATSNTTETFRLFKANGSPVYLKSNLGFKNDRIYVISIDVTDDILNTVFKEKVNDLAQLGGWNYNPELDIADWTPTIFQILEVDQAYEVHRDAILDYIHPNCLDYFNKTVDLLFLKHEPYDIDIKIITAKNRTKWVRVTAQPEIRHDQVVFIHGTLQDITVEKLQSIALEETKINMELALRAMNSGYFTHDLEDNKVVYSSSFRDKMKMPSGLSDEQFLNFIHPEDRDEAFLQHKREIATDSAYYVNAYRFKAHNSRAYKHFEVHGFKVFNSKGKPVKLVGNLIDVEDKYRLTQMQDKHRYHMKTLLDNAFVRSIMLDKDWNLIGMDGDTLQFFKNKLDYNPVSRKQNFKELLSDHDLLKFQIVERILNEGREYRKEIFLELFNHDRTYYDALFKPILDYSNKVDGFVFYFFDLTDQVIVQNELQSYQDKLKTVHHFKNNLITKLGHEIKTPLHGLLQTTQLIFQKENILTENLELINAQKESAKRLMNTFDNVINSSLYEDNFFLIEENVNLTQILNQVYNNSITRAEARGLDLQFNNFHGPAFVKADSVFLKQALENLLDNAFKFTEKGQIDIKTAIVNSHVEITLEDTGIGIPKNKIKDIFEPFEQVSSGLTRAFEGLGLGLTFAVKYIEGIGGHLHVESEIGRGTTFRLAMPLVE